VEHNVNVVEVAMPGHTMPVSLGKGEAEALSKQTADALTATDDG